MTATSHRHADFAAGPDVRTDPPQTGPWRMRFAEDALPGAHGIGPLAGVRVAVKDVFAVAGERIGAGNPTVLGNAGIESSHSTAVQALVDAGATLAGIARTDELAFSIAGVNAHEGAIANPTRPGFLVGGSSSGSAAAVVAGEADLGLGTDTAGSIRVPASYCGLWGLRLTHGAVGMEGLRPLAPSFDAVGILARDVGVLSSAAQALGATDAGAPASRMLIPAALLDLVEQPARAAFLAAAGALASRIGLPHTELGEVAWSRGELEEWFVSFRAIQAYEAWQVNHELLDIDGAISADIRSRILAGQNVDAQLHRSVLKEARAAVLAQLDGDAVLCLPGTSTTAPELGVSHEEQERLRAGTLRLTFLAALAGLPALSVPHLIAADAPMGLGLLGAPGEDLKLIRLAS